MLFYSLSLTELCTDGTIRLRGSTYATYGRVELCMNSIWGTVCNTFWDDKDASVVCKQLGFAPHGKVIAIVTLLNNLIKKHQSAQSVAHDENLLSKQGISLI